MNIENIKNKEINNNIENKNNENFNLEDEKKNCLNCLRKPCKKGCPLNNDIPAFIHENDTKKAFEKLCETTVLPSICARVCYKEEQCEKSCIKGIRSNPVNIGIIESYIGDKSLEKMYEIPKNIVIKDKSVAIVGGGPAGITAAAFLARAGVNITIYEKHAKLGGILSFGIPKFRLESEIVDKTIEKILNIGNINVKLNCELGKNIFLSELKLNYDAVLLAFGANKSLKMNIDGEELDGVFGANEILEYNSNMNLKNKKVAVIGGGNVAMDISRTAKRNGAKEVTIIYRRSKEQMPANGNEFEDVKKENINFLFQNNVIKILPNSNDKAKVGKVECVKTELVKKEGSTRLVPINIENSNYLLDVDIVFMAIGARTEENVIDKLNLSVDKFKNIEIDDEYKTSEENIFACGDLIGGEKTVAWASMTGREAAKNIIKNLTK